MSDQIVLSWTVDVGGTTVGPAEAAAALGAVPLYVDPVTDSRAWGALWPHRRDRHDVYRAHYGDENVEAQHDGSAVP